ncbi:MAG: DUF2934 domain-containing protein [Chthoniobacteraceae bacterium]
MQTTPSFTGLGAHFDEELEIATLALHFYEEEGRPDGHALEHWLRAEQEIHHRCHAAPPQTHEDTPTEADRLTEELMHLHQ